MSYQTYAQEYAVPDLRHVAIFVALLTGALFTYSFSQPLAFVPSVAIFSILCGAVLVCLAWIVLQRAQVKELTPFLFVTSLLLSVTHPASGLQHYFGLLFPIWLAINYTPNFITWLAPHTALILLGSVYLDHSVAQPQSIAFYLLSTGSIAIALYSTSAERKRFSRLSFIDPTTGIANRLSFNHARKSLDQSIARQILKDYSVLAIDIDHFKRVNDSYGHTAGDEVLACVARRLSDSLRGVDSVFRTGGEEFTILLPGTPDIELKLIAERLRRAVAATTLKCSNQELTVTVSIGGASFQSASHEHKEVFEVADQQLYDAKNTGRNRVSIFTTPNKKM
ncbi:MAG: hypothetical protein C9356_15780 [Oleiphilus sp.]|nr:MAG: hypothetical protein C9356_15780 [Oleiphilus sp.]